MSKHFSAKFDKLNARFPAQEVFGEGAILHLYHAPNSVCSQKVRAVLFQQQRAFVSHLLNIFLGETYDAIYVEARLSGCLEAGYALATSHGESGEGSTSVSNTGCDPCVVPLLADVERNSFLVDSQHICFSLATSDSNGSNRLVPAQFADDIARHIEVIDNLPNYQLLATHVAGERKQGGVPDNSFARGKVERCEKLIEQNKHDPDLVRAYTAKREKELRAADRLFSDAEMKRANQRMSEAIAMLETELPADPARFLLGDHITLADLFWGVELIRLADLGLNTAWENGKLPKVAAYYALLCEQESLKRAIINWPDARLKKAH